jgi:hypothetical protein
MFVPTVVSTVAIPESDPDQGQVLEQTLQYTPNML